MINCSFKMFLKHLIFVSAFLVVAYAMSVEPLDPIANEEPHDVAQLEQQPRDKRGHLKKALLVGVAYGLGLFQGANLGHRYPPYPYPSHWYPYPPPYPYPNYGYPYPPYGYNGPYYRNRHERSESLA